MGIQQNKALKVILLRGEIESKKIAEEIGVKNDTVVHLCEQLQNRGLVRSRIVVGRENNHPFKKRYWAARPQMSQRIIRILGLEGENVSIPPT